MNICQINALKTECPKGHPLNEENTFVRIRSTNGRLQRRCKICARIQANRSGREYQKKFRKLVLDFYGRKCILCGYDKDERALDLDHIDNMGGKHRKEVLKAAGNATYKWVIANNFPDIFQIVCRNCDWIKHQDNIKAKSVA